MEESAQSRRILFVTYGGSHAPMILPVVKASQARGWECVVLALTTGAGHFRRAGIAHMGFADLLQPGDERARRWGKKLSTDNQHPDVEVAESEAYLGLSYVEMEERLSREAAAQQYQARGRYSFLPIGILDRALTKWAPRLVVSTNSARAERAAMLAARSRGVRALCLVDLFGRDFSSEWLGVPGFADRIAVMSEQVKSELISIGAKAEEIVVTGNPAFDRLRDPELALKASALKQRLGLGSRKVILWAAPGPSVEPALLVAMEAEIQRLAALHPEWAFLARCHPSHSTRDLGDSVYLSRPQDDLATALFAADAVITTVSTVGLEALALNRPLIAIWDPKDGPSVPYAEFGMAIGVANLSDLAAAIEKSLQSYSQLHAFLPDATERVIQLMEQMMLDRALPLPQ